MTEEEGDDEAGGKLQTLDHVSKRGPLKKNLNIDLLRSGSSLKQHKDVLSCSVL